MGGRRSKELLCSRLVDGVAAIARVRREKRSGTRGKSEPRQFAKRFESHGVRAVSIPGQIGEIVGEAQLAFLPVFTGRTDLL